MKSKGRISEGWKHPGEERGSIYMTRSLDLEPRQPYEVVSITPTSQGRGTPLLQTPQPIPRGGEARRPARLVALGRQSMFSDLGHSGGLRGPRDVDCGVCRAL